MIDPKDLAADNSDDGFADDSSDNASFKLESMESYPSELPYAKPSVDPNAPAPDASNDIADASLIASLKQDLERSAQKKTRKDSLEDSINRLRQSLQSDASPATDDDSDIPTEAAQPDPPSIPEAAPEPIVVLEDLPEMSLSSGEEVAVNTPPVDVAIPGDENGADPETQSMTEPTNKSRRVYLLAALICFLALGGGITWWKFGSSAHVQNEGAVATSTVVDSSHSAKNETSAEHPTISHDSSHHGIKHDSAAEAVVADHSAKPETPGHSDDINKSALAQSKAHDEPSSHVGSDSKIDTSPDGHHSASNPTKVKSALAQKHLETKADAHEKTKDLSKDHASLDDRKSAQKQKVDWVKSKNESAMKVDPPALSKDHSKELVDKPSHESISKTAIVNLDKKNTPAPQSTLAANKAEKLGIKPPTTSLAQSKKSNDEKSNSPVIGSPEVAQKVTNNEREKLKEIAQEKPRNSSTQSAAEKKSPSTVSKESNKGVKSDEKSSGAITASTVVSAVKVDPYSETRMVAKPVIRNVPASAKGLYTVQVYSTPSQEDAEEWTRRLRNKNVEGSFISKQSVRGITYYRVRFGSYTTKEEAEGAALHSGFASGWIDRVK